MANKGIQRSLILLNLSCYFFFISPSLSYTDTLIQGQKLRDNDQLVSADGTFKLGFFSPGTSKNRYLGIWYNKQDEEAVLIAKRNVVWVANRNIPISDASGNLMIDKFGGLAISYGGGSPIVLHPVQAATNASVTLLDSGNFMLKELNSDGSTKRILWQSFDYPTDTLLPGMKLGFGLKNDHVWSLTSWISDDVPAEGSFTLTTGGDANRASILVIWWKGNAYWTSGAWQNGHFEFVPRLSNEGYHNFSLISNDDETYFTYSSGENHTLSRYMIDPAGAIVETKGLAPFGACSYTFDPGCVEQKFPDCRSRNDRFKQRKGFMVGEGLKFDESYNLSLFDCKVKCLNNCSCIAYASINGNQTGCEIWSQGMSFTTNNGARREIYVLSSKKAKWWIWLVIAVTGLVAILMLCLVYFFIRRKLRVQGPIVNDETEQEMLLYELEVNTTHSSKSRNAHEPKRDGKKSHELQFFSFENVEAATDNFAATNKLGEGGFGLVYKGKLQDGQEVAIKRLSTNSGQGLVEFKNELILISKLQHTNLVKLVGCSVQREEKILIYEYMKNKSLDCFLFDPLKKNILDWEKRFNIIEGIAQGLLYLHKYSRLRIVHRDLKSGNILLDDEMNPKISDFGMARIFGRHESEAKTKRVVGTHGYMSPEYALKGIVSIKVDVFSYGVLLLEILSGKKNNSCDHSEHPLSLIGFAWKLWNEGRGLELIDPTLDESYPHNDVLKCIHIGLLCVQDRATDRPTMSDIVSMLTNETLQLPAPKQPLYFTDAAKEVQEVPENTLGNCSLNDVSITEGEGR